MTVGISPNNFLNSLQASGIRFFTGVPDSLLKEFNACLIDSLTASEHIIAANEGAAVGMAIGHYLASKCPALVYMQNSGLGNSVNPLVSLADPLVMGCPLILLIGWRGEVMPDGSQLKDEPQHKQQGRITLSQLDSMGIPYQELNKDIDFKACINKTISLAIERQGPVAIIVRKDTFAKYSKNFQINDEGTLITREAAIAAVLEVIPKVCPVVSTTGMASRELFELRQMSKVGHEQDLLCVGAMGHASSIAAGIALAKPNKKVVCLDGDGAMIMHLGAITNSGVCSNLIHIVLNNASHDSVGGQPTRAGHINLSRIAEECGYEFAAQARNLEDIDKYLHKMVLLNKSCFLEILCRRGNRLNLGRPMQTPSENRENFMMHLERNE